MDSVLVEFVISMIPGFEGVVAPAMSVVAASIVKVGIILAVLTVLFIAAFVVGRVFLKKKKAVATVNYAPVVPETAVPEVEETTEEKAE